VLYKKNFICARCGECCKKYTVKLSENDIRKIEKLGYKKQFFAEKDSFDIQYGKYALKKKNEKCIFLVEKNKEAFCKIYDIRPRICSQYPFFSEKEMETCHPDENLFLTKTDK
jgi:uncharacterized protein